MNEHSLKNIDFKTVLNLSEQVEYRQGMIVSKTLVQNKAVGITLFAFDQKEEISSHHSGGDAILMVLEGTALITLGDQKIHMEAGETIVMPAGISHAVVSESRFKMLLTVVFPS